MKSACLRLDDNPRYVRVPRIVISLSRRFQHLKLRVAALLLAVFVANILATGAGLAASTDWLEHEKSHLAALHDAGSQDHPQSVPDQPSGKPQIQHDCHASHFFQCHVTTSPLVFPPSTSGPPTAFHVALMPDSSTEAPFRPPR